MSFLKQNKITIIAFTIFSLISILSWLKIDNPQNISQEIPQKTEPTLEKVQTKPTKEKVITPEKAKPLASNIKSAKSKQNETDPATNIPKQIPKENNPRRDNPRIVPTGIVDTGIVAEKPEQKTIQATIQIDTEKFTITLPESSTAFDALTYLKKIGKIDFKTKEFSGMGYFVEEINGLSNEPKSNHYWGYYINGSSANQGASSYILKNNDNILWKYDKITF